jgi:hypothetical protein
MLLLSGCAHEYQPPKPGEPHATLKVRLSYHAWPGPSLEQTVAVDGDDLRGFPAPAPAGVGGVATHALLVRPGTIGCTVTATFFHNDVTSHAETYETSQTAPCGSSTCTQVTPHTRLVNHVDRVDDATCTQGLRFRAESSESYLLEYDFLADQRCALKCYRQARHAKGAQASVPCDDSAKAR